MKRAIVIIALLAIVPVLVAAVVYLPGLAAYFAKEPVKSAAQAREPVKPAPPASAVATSSPPPVVEGPSLHPPEVPGQQVTKPFREERAENTITVRSGDTLFKIAQRHYGDASYTDEILAANPGLDPGRLRVGQKLVMPPKTVEGQGPAKPANEPKIYVVKPGESLVSIARRQYADAAMATVIFNLNRDQLKTQESLRPGMRLRLPPPPQY